MRSAASRLRAGDAQLVLRGQHLEIGVGDGDDGRQRDDLAIVARGRRVLLRGMQRRAVLAPEVEHVARGQCRRRCCENVVRRPAAAGLRTGVVALGAADCLSCDGNSGAPETPTCASACTIWAIATAISRL